MISDDDLAKSDTDELVDRVHQEEMADFRVVMATSAGRRFMYRLIHHYARVLSLSHASNAGDAAFNDGMRNVGLQMLRHVDEACRDKHILMLQEHMDMRHMRAEEIKAEAEKRAEDEE